VDASVIALAAGAAAVIALVVWGMARVSRRAEQMHGEQMGLLAHLRELRYRLLASLGSVAAVTIVLFTFDVRRVAVFDRVVWAPWPSMRDNLATRGLNLLLDHVLPASVDVVVIAPSEAILV
jgi:Sec-independent protein secretion pathway component TatC